MSRFIDMTGWIMKEHGIPDSRWTILNKLPIKHNSNDWLAKCECGTIKEVNGRNVRAGKSKSCGCLREDKIIDMTGWKMWEHGNPLSKIEIIKRIPKPENSEYNGAWWQCRCGYCNKIFNSSTNKIIGGRIISCGCKGKIKYDLAGKIYGRLTVLQENTNYRKEHNLKNTNTYWDCLCLCGNIITTSTQALISGHTKSCGCLNNENASKLGKQKRKNLQGQTFGFLTVLGPAGYKKGNNNMWKCLCKCGNITDVRTSCLISGHTISCGCSYMSKGELKIQKILQDNGIIFKYNIGMNDFVNKKMRYDFVIYDENNKIIRIIEFDGIQHYESREHFGGEEALQETQKRDNIKNNYAFSHNIPLIRIPYWERDNITLEMLMGDQYLVNPIPIAHGDNGFPTKEEA